MTSHKMSFRQGDRAGSYTPQVTPRVAQALKASGAIVVDVREKKEFDAGHIGGAVQVSRQRLKQEVSVRIPDTAQAIVCYCTTGFRSAQAVAALQKLGYSGAVSIAGGLNAYLAEAEPPWWRFAPEPCPVCASGFARHEPDRSAPSKRRFSATKRSRSAAA